MTVITEDESKNVVAILDVILSKFSSLHTASDADCVMTSRMRSSSIKLPDYMSDDFMEVRLDDFVFNIQCLHVQ